MIDEPLIEGACRRMAAAMGDEPDLMVTDLVPYRTTLHGHHAVSANIFKDAVPIWTLYRPAAEAALRYLLVERVVQVQRDTIDPAVKANVFDTSFDAANLRYRKDPNPKHQPETHLITEDDSTDPVHDALWVMIDSASNLDDTHVDAKLIFDACELLSRVGYLANLPGKFWSEDDCWKPNPDVIWSVVQFAHSVHGIGSDFMWKARAKLFPGAITSVAQDHST